MHTQIKDTFTKSRMNTSENRNLQPFSSPISQFGVPATPSHPYLRHIAWGAPQSISFSSIPYQRVGSYDDEQPQIDSQLQSIAFPQPTSSIQPILAHDKPPIITPQPKKRFCTNSSFGLVNPNHFPPLLPSLPPQVEEEDQDMIILDHRHHHHQQQPHAGNNERVSSPQLMKSNESNSTDNPLHQYHHHRGVSSMITKKKNRGVKENGISLTRRVIKCCQFRVEYRQTSSSSRSGGGVGLATTPNVTSTLLGLNPGQYPLLRGAIHFIHCLNCHSFWLKTRTKTTTSQLAGEFKILCEKIHIQILSLEQTRQRDLHHTCLDVERIMMNDEDAKSITRISGDRPQNQQRLVEDVSVEETRILSYFASHQEEKCRHFWIEGAINSGKTSLIRRLRISMGSSVVKDYHSYRRDTLITPTPIVALHDHSAQQREKKDTITTPPIQIITIDDVDTLARLETLYDDIIHLSNENGIIILIFSLVNLHELLSQESTTSAIIAMKLSHRFWSTTIKDLEHSLYHH